MVKERARAQYAERCRQAEAARHVRDTSATRPRHVHDTATTRPRQVSLVAHGLGAVPALRMLERQPTLVSSLSLLSPYGSLADSRPARKCLGSVEEVSRKCL